MRNMNFIKFVDNDADGCGTVVECFIVTEKVLTDEDRVTFQTIVDRLKSEEEDWDFDWILEESCAEFFGSIPYEIVNANFDIYL